MSVYITREMLRQAARAPQQFPTDNILSRVVRAAKRAARQRRTVAELSVLTDRELRDIGLWRADIPRVVGEMTDHDFGLAPARRPAPRAARAPGNAAAA